MAIEKLTISKIAKFTTKKDGTPLKTKAGKPYTSIRIQALEHGEKWLSGFGGSWNDNWSEGDQVSVDVTQNGEYLNFSKVDTESVLLGRVEELEKTVAQIKAVLKPIYEEWQREQEVPKDDYPTEDINPDNIPF